MTFNDPKPVKHPRDLASFPHTDLSICIYFKMFNALEERIYVSRGVKHSLADLALKLASYYPDKRGKDVVMNGREFDSLMEHVEYVGLSIEDLLDSGILPR